MVDPYIVIFCDIDNALDSANIKLKPISFKIEYASVP